MHGECHNQTSFYVMLELMLPDPQSNVTWVYGKSFGCVHRAVSWGAFYVKEGLVIFFLNQDSVEYPIQVQVTRNSVRQTDITTREDILLQSQNDVVVDGNRVCASV